MDKQLATITDFLSAPAVNASLETCGDYWQAVALRFVCTRPQHFEHSPGFADRVRGALGRVLMEDGERYFDTTRPRFPLDNAAMAFRILFSSDWMRGPLGGVHRPFALRTWEHDGSIHIELVLFGLARLWCGSLEQALVHALKRGIAIKTHSRHRLRLPPIASSQEWINALSPPLHYERSLTMRLLSPLVLRSGGRMQLAPEHIVPAAVKRLQGLARWMGVGLSYPAELCRPAETGIFYDEAGVMQTTWDHPSTRDGVRTVGRMEGLIGELVLSGDIGLAHRALKLAEHCSIGSATSMGCGHYALS